MMAVLMFQPQFARLVESGAKRQTVRPQRARPIKVEDRLSLREWTGKPYRSPQRVLREASCLQACSITIRRFGLQIGRDEQQWIIHPADLDRFARNDGFENWRDLFEWFCATHRTDVFCGMLYRW